MPRTKDPMEAFRTTHTVENMTDALEVACNHSRITGKLDAIAHIGGLAAGTISPQQVELHHLESLQTSGPDFDPTYAWNYVQTWEDLFRTVTP